MDNRRQNASASNTRQPYQSNIPSGKQQNQTSTRTKTSAAPASSVRSNAQEQSHSRSQRDADYKINPTPSNRNLYQSNTRQQEQQQPSTRREQMGIQPTSNVARNSTTSPSMRTKPTANTQEEKSDSSFTDSSSGGSVVSSGHGDRQPYQNYQTSNVSSKQQYLPGASTKQQNFQPGSIPTGTKVTRNIAINAPSMNSKTSVTEKCTTQKRNPSITSSSSSQETTEGSSGEYGSILGLNRSIVSSETTPSETVQQVSPERGTSVEGNPSFEWGSTSTWTSTQEKNNSYWPRECGGQSCNDPCCCYCRSSKNCTPTKQRTNSNYEQQERVPLPTQRDQNKGRSQTDYKHDDQACYRSSKPSCNQTQTETPCIQPRGQGRPIMTSPEKGKYFYENRPNRPNYEPGPSKPSMSYEPVKRPRDRPIVQSPTPSHSSPRREHYQPQPNTSPCGIDRQYVGSLDLIPPVKNEVKYSNTSPRPKRRKPNIPPEAKPTEEPDKKSSVRHWYNVMSSAVCSLFNTDEQSSTSEQIIPKRSHVRNKLKRRRSNTSSSSITIDTEDKCKPTLIFIKEATIYINDTQSQDSEDSGSPSRSLVGVEVRKDKRQRQSNSQNRRNSSNQYKPIRPLSESSSSEGTQDDRAAYILASCAKRICESKGCCGDSTTQSKKEKGKKKK